MTTKEFKRNYLSHYSLLETDFVSTFNYVSVEEDNYKTYSNMYLKLLLAVGSEIDILKKFVAVLYNHSFNEKKDNVNAELLKQFPDIKTIEIKFRNNGKVYMPWNFEKEPEWWTVYNEIKHNRLEQANKFDDTKKYYQYANLENAIHSLAALFSLELIAYRKIAIDSGEKLFVPVIKSLFSINNSYWNEIQHGMGFVFLGGTVYMED